MACIIYCHKSQKHAFLIVPYSSLQHQQYKRYCSFGSRISLVRTVLEDTVCASYPYLRFSYKQHSVSSVLPKQSLLYNLVLATLTSKGLAYASSKVDTSGSLHFISCFTSIQFYLYNKQLTESSLSGCCLSGNSDSGRSHSIFWLLQRSKSHAKS